MELKLVKGTKDYLPEEQIKREQIKELLVKTFKLYGFNPVETPILEEYAVLASKYAGGAEILKETYSLKDQGRRKLALRYDLTVPLSRLIGMNPNIKLPFKKYEIGKVFRDGPVKTARLREFTQCDADIIGIKSMIADAELIALSLEVLKKLKLEGYVEVNNRKLLSGILETAGINKNNISDVILSIDKLKKIGVEEVKKELIEKGIKKSSFNDLFNLLTINKDNSEVLEKLSKKVTNEVGKQGIKELQELFDYLKELNIKENVRLLPSLARGLEIYTGTAFEVFLKNSEIKSSIAAGGRFDKIISQFLKSKQEFPAVGISFGLDVLYEALKKEPAQKSTVKAYIIPINTINQCLNIVKKLRDSEIEADLDQVGKSISKNLDYADKLGIAYAIIVGEDELKKNKVKLKDMKTGKEEYLSVEDVINKLKKA
ncbi:histidine--tRNA ligase [Candidatus Woesearchaeota archaeon]|nr:histidine--tRNA ligase [Candidatus Woesearchaeota archaeon]